MRLPQSNTSHSSLRPFFFTTLIAVVLMLPLGARAATPQLVCSPANLRFGSVDLSGSETQVVRLINTGSTSVKVSAISESGSQFSLPGLSLPMSLAAGQSVALNVVFSPNAAGWIGGKVTFTSTASNPSLDLVVGGVGVHTEPLTAAPSSVSFGQVAVGTQATRSVKVTNPHSWTETVSGLQAAGLGFAVSGPSLPVKLGAGQSVTLSVSFSPKIAGEIGGRIFISGPAMAIPLTGTGSSATSGSLTITPAKLSFGSVMLGETGMQTAVLSAVGTSVTISSAASSSGQFTLPGATFPVTIAAGQSLQVNVAFTPTAAGNASGKLSFSSNASDSQASEQVAGTGTAPQVSLAWSPSTSQVEGYNVYRGAAPGSYTKINANLDANTSFTDTTVKAGTTYYYAATAVNSSGQESTYSAPVEVQVP